MKTVWILMSLVALPCAWAGEEGAGSSGGGAAVVCRKGRKIVRAELLDIYEGRNHPRRKFLIPDRDTPVLDQVERALRRLTADPLHIPLMRQVAAEVVLAMEFLPKGVSFHSPEDLGKKLGILVPDGCAVEGVGYY